MNEIKLILITWLLHVNQFPHILSITLQFASNNSHIVQNSETIANKGKTNSRLEFSKSLEVPNNDQRLVKMLIWLKSSNGVSSKKKKRLLIVYTFSKLKESGISMS